MFCFVVVNMIVFFPNWFPCHREDTLQILFQSVSQQVLFTLWNSTIQNAKKWCFFISLLSEIADYSHGLFLWRIYLFQKVFSRMNVRAYPSSALIVSIISAKDSLICDWLTVFVDVPLRGSGIYNGSHTSCLNLPLAYGESIAISLIYHCFIIAICLQCVSPFNIHVSAH